MNIYQVRYTYMDHPNAILRKLFIVSDSYTEVEKVLERNGTEFVQSITNLGPVLNSEALKDG